VYSWRGTEAGADGVLGFPWVEYSDAVGSLVSALYGVGAVAFPHWAHWASDNLERTIDCIGEAPLDDVVAAITAMVRSDRFSEGALAAVLEDGSLLAAVDRLIELAGH